MDDVLVVRRWLKVRMEAAKLKFPPSSCAHRPSPLHDSDFHLCSPLSTSTEASDSALSPVSNIQTLQKHLETGGLLLTKRKTPHEGRSRDSTRGTPDAASNWPLRLSQEFLRI